MKLMEMAVSWVLGILNVFAGAGVLVKVWQWFVTPNFQSAPTLSYKQAVAAGMVMAALSAGTALTRGRMMMKLETIEGLVKQKGTGEAEKQPFEDEVWAAGMLVIGYPLLLLFALIVRWILG